jgi:hypothetical protein
VSGAVHARAVASRSQVDGARRSGADVNADRHIALFYFAADVTGDEPRFDYRLREGVSEQRLGMTLLRREGVLDRLERSAMSDNLPGAAPEMGQPR